jgi:PAS domain S-box-containing protein
MSENSPDVDILSHIILMQSTLHVMQDESRLGDFVCQGLMRVPGVQSAIFCLQGKLVAASSAEVKALYQAEVECGCGLDIKTHFSSHANLCRRMADNERFVYLSLQTSHYPYGGLFLEVSDDDRFNPYLPYLQNTVNLIALVIENRRNHNQLTQFAASLEEQILERTRELSRTNQLLKESEHRYAAAQKAANIGSWQWNIETNEISWSETIEPMFGFDEGQFGGTYDAFMETVHADDRSLVEKAVQDALGRVDGGYTIEHRVVRPDRQIRWLLETGEVICDDSGKPVCMVGIVQDITERKEAEIERIKLMKTLKAKNEELKSIVYIASHDLRSPLVNIQGFSQELFTVCTKFLTLIEGIDIDPAMRQNLTAIVEEDVPMCLKFITTSADKMDVLLNGLLQISRIGTVTIEIRPLDMNHLIAEVLQTYEFVLKEKQIECTVDDLPGCMGDAQQMYQAFSNLISNAIKYLDPSRSGVVHVSGYSEKGYSVYCFRDNGIGISENHQAKIFELFHRLNPSDIAGGEGLGLTIVRRIIDRLDGSIRVESEPGRGSCFFVSLPAI